MDDSERRRKAEAVYTLVKLIFKGEGSFEIDGYSSKVISMKNNNFSSKENYNNAKALVEQMGGKWEGGWRREGTHLDTSATIDLTKRGVLEKCIEVLQQPALNAIENGVKFENDYTMTEEMREAESLGFGTAFNAVTHYISQFRSEVEYSGAIVTNAFKELGVDIKKRVAVSEHKAKESFGRRVSADITQELWPNRAVRAR